MKISRADARRVALHCQGLDGSWDLPTGKEGVAQTVERLGYVQIDTISVVQRAHHHTLWARRPDYAPEMLHDLQAADRRVFEWWAPAASYLPMRDYRYYLRRMRATGERPKRQVWVREHAELLQHVRGRIQAEGALGARDFEAPEGFERGSWWSWKPAKRALEVLFDSGELMVTERRGFERIYDLRERVQPDVVLMDLVMPGMDGAAATRAVRERCPQIQVIALTSFKERELVQGGTGGGIGYLLKNVTADELADAIRAAHAGPGGGPGADPGHEGTARAGL